MSRLAEHTTTTAGKALAGVDVARLPTGSVEQHGPALSLGADFMVAQAVAGELDERENVVTIVEWLAEQDIADLSPQVHR